MYSVEEFQEQKSKVMNFILYKKRTEKEVKNKFYGIIPDDMLEEIIEYVKEAGYLSDADYIEKAINEFMKLKNLSIKEIAYKLYAKGIKKEDLENYLDAHKDELEEYEKSSANNIYNKKIKTTDKEQIKSYLIKKGYNKDIIYDLIN